MTGTKRPIQVRAIYQQLTRGVAAFMITILGVSFLTQHVHVVINTSTSLPGKVFVVLPHLSPGKGDVTTYWHPSGKRLIKQVIGVAGDEITYTQASQLHVAGKSMNIAPSAKDTPLTPIAPGRIPEGHVFLYAPHPESFDSRYSQVGLVYHHHLRGRAYVLLA